MDDFEKEATKAGASTASIIKTGLLMGRFSPDKNMSADP
jgi:hypothetical protein